MPRKKHHKKHAPGPLKKVQVIQPTVHCPGCRRTQPQQGPQTIYWCQHCEAQFDDDPDEGGDYSDRSPSARLERQERRTAQGGGRRMEGGKDGRR